MAADPFPHIFKTGSAWSWSTGPPACREKLMQTFFTLGKILKIPKRVTIGPFS